MPLYDPKNDTDNVSYGFLKKVLGDKLYENSKNTSISYSKNFGSLQLFLIKKEILGIMVKIFIFV